MADQGSHAAHSRPLTSFYHSPKHPFPWAASFLSANPAKDQGPLTLSPGYLLLVLPNTIGYRQITNPGKANLGSALFPQSDRENGEGLHPRPVRFHFPCCSGVQMCLSPPLYSVSPSQRALSYAFSKPNSIIAGDGLCSVIDFLACI